jgi:hypothetical protein
MCPSSSLLPAKKILMMAVATAQLPVGLISENWIRLTNSVNGLAFVFNFNRLAISAIAHDVARL